MLQKRLDEDTLLTFRHALIQTVTPYFADLMMDQFGNYLSQKILEVSDAQEIKGIIGTILPTITEISTNIHGTRAIQFLVQVLFKLLPQLEDDLMTIIQELNFNIRQLSLDVHGNHVIQSFLCIFKAS